jgi:TolA-binding protein
LALTVLALAASTATVRVSAADKTQDALLEIQRDISTMQGDIRDLQKAQADQLTQLKALLQQAVDASVKSSESTAQAQKGLSDTLNSNLKAAMADQQTKLTAPIADLNSKANEMGQQMTAVQTQVSEMSQRMTRMESKLNDVYTAVTTAPAVVPPPPGPGPVTTSTTLNSETPPAGVTVSSLKSAAERDYAAGNSLALQELADFIKYFHDDAYAPTAQYRIAQLYDSAKQYDDSAAAFDAVVTRFPTNEKTSDAAYMKGVELQKAGKKPEALEQFKNVENTYPGTESARNAKARIAELNPTSKGRGKR